MGVRIGLVALLLAGCAPVSGEQIARLVDALAADRASACVTVWAGAGGGAVTLAPAVPVAGGYGYLIVGRTNEPGSRVFISKDGCTIEHGKVGP